MEKEYFCKQFTADCYAVGKMTKKAFPSGKEMYYEGVGIDKDGDNVILERSTNEDIIDEEEFSRLAAKTKEDIDKARAIYDKVLEKIKKLTVVDNENYLSSDDFRDLDCAGEIRGILLDAYNKIEQEIV